MNPAELLAEAAAAGLRVEFLPDGRLGVRPKSRAAPAMLEKLRAAKPALMEHLLRRERLMAAAAERLREHPELQRAAQIAQEGEGALVGIAVRMPGGGIATAALTVPRADPFELVAAFDRACKAQPS